MGDFKGYNANTFAFLKGITENNNREWFLQHKEQYLEDVLKPTKLLASETFGKLSARYPDLRVSVHIPRIYKDFRRVRNGRYYNDDFWFLIRHQNYEKNRVCFFLKITQGDYYYGSCIFQPSPAVMSAFRQAIDNHGEIFKPFVKTFNKQDLFYLEGEDYKRPKGGCPQLFNQWYNKKWIALTSRHLVSDRELFKDDVSDILCGAYTQLMPFFEFAVLSEKYIL